MTPVPFTPEQMETLAQDFDWLASRSGPQKDTAAMLRQAAAQARELAALRERASTLEDAAFHFQSCATCRAGDEDACESGRHFAAFLRGVPLPVCTGPFSDAHDCPVHDPRARRTP